VVAISVTELKLEEEEDGDDETESALLESNSVSEV
jgi:hypothetical protein